LKPRVLILFLTCIGLAAPAADWPQFLGPNRNGSSPGPPLAESWPQEGPSRVWDAKVGEGFSGPVVAANRLILFHRVANEERVECREAKSGAKLWQFSYPTTYRDDFGFDEGPRATPAIADGKVYTFGAEGALHCLDAATGRLEWKLDARRDYGAGKGFFGMACSPLVEGELVLLNIGGKEGAGIVALDKKNGKLRWKATSEEASYSSPVAATLQGKRYAFFFAREHLIALTPQDGSIIFQFRWQPTMRASVSAATPLIIGGQIFISASYGAGAALLQFAESGPKLIWSGDDILSNHYATSVEHSGFLYGYDGRQEEGCNLRCVELKTGKVRWSEERFGAGTVTLAGDSLLLLKENGELLKAPASPREFKPAARAQILPFQVRAYPALAEGLFYARSKDRIVCVDLR
jgi:outer membrane protein assembly factor BamB